MLVLLCILLVEVALILNRNDGTLIYTLDDPYIHLAVAEEIRRGGYGVNPGEVSTPSSSVIWPLLLAPLGAGPWLPLALNVPLAIAVALVLALLVEWMLPDVAGANLLPMRLALAALLVVSTNAVGLALTGMEHSAHQLATVLLVLGFWIEARTGRVPGWLLVALVAGPLFRYEAVAFSLPGILLLAARGHRRAAVGCALIIVSAFAGFAAFLLSEGQSLLPTSVLAKSGAAAGPSLSSILTTAHLNLLGRQGAMLALIGLFVGFAALDRSRSAGERSFALWAFSGVALQLLVGPFGWFNRYELYAFSAALVAALLLCGSQLASFAARRPVLSISAVTLVLATLATPYWDGLRAIPGATSNIYRQQYQMHRFVTEFWRAPVAVNDLGWVSYRNDDYVLDLWGLASAEALHRRQTDDDSQWLDDLTRERSVGLAMLYAEWFPKLPNGWTPVAELVFHEKLVSAANSRVVFYALDADAQARARPLLKEFGASLPAGTTLTLLEPPRDDAGQRP